MSYQHDYPVLPPPNTLTEFYTDSPSKPSDPNPSNSSTPIIRILAPTPDGGECSVVAPLALRPGLDGSSTASGDTQAPHQSWTDELVKQPSNTNSVFEHSSSSDDTDDDGSDATSESSGSVHSWPANAYYTRSPPRSPSISHAPRPSADACHICNAPSNEGPLDTEETSPYRGHIKLLQSSYTASRGVWALGQRSILKELEHDSGGRLAYEARNLEFAAQHTTAAVPQVLASWKEEGDDSSFLLMSRIPGQTLEAAWPDLSAEAKENIARDAVAHLRELRSVTHESMSGVDGGAMLNAETFFGRRGNSGAPGPCSSQDEVWAHMLRALNSDELELGEAQFLRDSMPRVTPAVFSHGDLSARHIMVRDAKFAGFVDFAQSGFYPAWWEWVHSHDIDTLFDGQWKMVLRKHMESSETAFVFQQALDWYDYWIQIQLDPNSQKARRSKQDLAKWRS
ncbi:putative Kinase-like domain-containing protein [Seiridium cardinale]|uniref:Kinase-like domain-containing protein n=1 Tax=Seiridium cardinale TaxID=138064 RepID=A0ABR2XV94_9PEZI